MCAECLFSSASSASFAEDENSEVVMKRVKAVYKARPGGVVLRELRVLKNSPA